MKVQYKLLAAAVAMAVATGAHATIDAGQTTDGTGELFVVVTDSTAGYSFLGDLGVSMNSFLASSGTSASFDLSSYTSWSPFVSAIGGSLSTAKFAVYALDNVGATTTVDAKRLLTTVNAGDDISGAAGNYTTGNSKVVSSVGSTIVTALNNMQAPANNLLADHGTLTSTNGSSYTNKPLGYADAQLGDSLKNYMPFVTTVAVGSNADFWLLGNSSSGTVAQADTFMQPGQFSITGSSLNYTTAAAVPEADTWAMMLAGLGLVGALVRRRKAA